MTPLTDLVAWLDALLKPERFRDYCPNGLQVEGATTVRKLATGVTASQAFLEAAAQWGADAVLVHHGYFWKGEAAALVGMKRRRIATLMANDMSLLAYHLPLDAHPQLGNNARLGQLLGLEDASPLDPDDRDGVGNVGRLPQPQPIGELLANIARLTGRQPQHIGDPQAVVQRVAWCTGAAQGYIDTASRAGAEVYISGEISEPTVHSAREQGLHYIAAGHHATELYGVQAVGERAAEHFGLEYRFIDDPNPV